MVTPAPTSLLPAAWADFTKSFGIYPETHVRVRHDLDRFLDLVAQILKSRPRLALTVHRDVARAGDDEVEVTAHANLRWLKDRLDRAALAGVALQPGLTAETVVAFTRRMLEHATRRDRVLSFAELWPEEWEGLRPLDRRFDVADGDRVDLGEARPGAAAVDTRTSRVLVELIQSSDSVGAQLDRVQETLAARGGQRVGDERVIIDLIAHLVEVLPDGVFDDPERALELTGQLLAQFEHELADDALTRGRDDRMIDAGKKQLVDEIEAAARTATAQLPRPAGENAADLAALQAEIALLPTEGSSPLDAAGDPDEQLGVYLHLLVRLESRETASRLHDVLQPLLAQPTSGQLQALRACLEEAAAMSEDSGDGEHLDRPLALLHQSNRTQLARSCGFLTASRVKDTFPRLFLPYLHTRDWRQPQEVAELEHLCKTVGRDALLDGRTELQRHGGIAHNGTDARLLAHPSEAMLPLVHYVLEEVGGRRLAAATRYVRSLRLPEPEARLLELLPGALPIEIVSALAARPTGGGYPAPTRELASELLCEFIRTSRGAAEQRAGRLEAIALLGDLGGDGARRLLTEILGAKRWFGLARESADARRAAEAALEHLAGGRTDV